MPSLTEIEGIGPSLAAACAKSNFRTFAKIAAASPSELSKVPGISEKGASQIIASAKSLLPKPQLPTTTDKNKKLPVGPVKIRTQSTAKPALKNSTKEKKMSEKEVKDKVKKLKKKIKTLKAEKKKVLAKDSKKSKKSKTKKSSKKK